MMIIPSLILPLYFVLGDHGIHIQPFLFVWVAQFVVGMLSMGLGKGDSNGHNYFFQA